MIRGLLIGFCGLALCAVGGYLAAAGEEGPMGLFALGAAVMLAGVVLLVWAVGS